MTLLVGGRPAGVSVVALPRTNLDLQGRDLSSSVPRGLTATRALLTAGANVAAGGDNARAELLCVEGTDLVDAIARTVVRRSLLPKSGALPEEAP